MNDSAERTNLIAKILLDEQTIARRAPQVEHEKKVAILDIVEFNRFQIDPILGDLPGPYELHISIIDRKLAFIIKSIMGVTLKEFYLSLSPLRRVIKDYHEICESYHKSINLLTPPQIETIDMARRGIHDEGGSLLRERFEEKIIMDKMTARRLFTLISILHLSVIT